MGRSVSSDETMYHHQMCCWARISSRNIKTTFCNELLVPWVFSHLAPREGSPRTCPKFSGGAQPAVFCRQGRKASLFLTTSLGAASLLSASRGTRGDPAWRQEGADRYPASWLGAEAPTPRFSWRKTHIFSKGSSKSRYLIRKLTW